MPKPFPSFLLMLLLLGLAAATPLFPEPRSLSGLQIYNVTMTADINGTIDYTSEGIYGFLNAIAYDARGATKGVLTIGNTSPYVGVLAIYDLSGGNITIGYRTESGNMSTITGPLTFAANSTDVTDANQTIEVWFFVER